MRDEHKPTWKLAWERDYFRGLTQLVASFVAPPRFHTPLRGTDIGEWLSSFETIYVLGEPGEFDEAIIGVCDGPDPRVVYDSEKIVAIFASQLDDCDDPHEAALEHFHYNVLGTWFDHGPLFVYPYVPS